MSFFTPREIVSELDRFIIGQGDAKRAGLAAQKAIDVVAEYMNTSGQKINKSDTALYETARVSVIGVSLAGLVVAVVFGFLSTRNLNRPIQGCVAITVKMAQGDFSSEVD